MNKLEMQIQSVDVRYDDSPNLMYYNLSCSLLNIYKGRCDLFLVKSNNNLRQELLIKHNRAIMEGNLIANDYFFEKFQPLEIILLCHLNLLIQLKQAHFYNQPILRLTIHLYLL